MAKPWRTGEGWVIVYPSGTQSLGLFPSEHIASNFARTIWGPDDTGWKVIPMAPAGSIRWQELPSFDSCVIDESAGGRDNG